MPTYTSIRDLMPSKADVRADNMRNMGGKARQAYRDAISGKMPTPPDFTAEPHAAYRKKLEQVIAWAEAGNLEALRNFNMRMNSSSTIPLGRYVHCAILALEAQTHAGLSAVPAGSKSAGLEDVTHAYSPVPLQDRVRQNGKRGRSLMNVASSTPTVDFRGSDELICWTRMQSEAGQQLDAIMSRKELERRAGGGIFFWGVGNPPPRIINELARRGQLVTRCFR
jgi:hypothetical protein